MPTEETNRLVLGLASRQHGIVSARQLDAVGLGRHAIAHRVAAGWLRRRHHGVYLVGPLETPLTDAMAAVLAYGAGALLSHGPAAVVWGLRPEPAKTIHITVAGRDARSRDGICAHSVRQLHPRDAARRHGIPLTSAARTLLDLATQLNPRDLARAADEARVQRCVTDLSLEEQFQRYPHHRGTAALAKVIQTEPAFTRSEAERRLLELIRAARLLEPKTNARVGGREVDFLWPEHGLVVEVDGYAFHSSRRAFERDRRRDAELTRAGIAVVRVTWRQIANEPEAVVATLAAALAVQERRPSALARSSTVSA
jgi:very-short-patch-repair endonuclease/predicted transcriptional regulator of viral defense system